MYHYYTCPELGQGKACLRRVPCHCQACDEQMRLPWSNGLEPKDQPRFASVKDCFMKDVLEQNNNWHFVELKMSNSVEEEDITEVQAAILHHVTTAVAEQIVVGQIGAIGTKGTDVKYGYYLVEFTGLPYTDQTYEAGLKCEVNWLYDLKNAPKWYTKSTTSTTIDVMHLLMAGVEMVPYSLRNMPPVSRNLARENNALRISEESHNFIADEILRRNDIDFDITRVYSQEEEEDEEVDE